MSCQVEHPPEQFKTPQFKFLSHIYVGTRDKDKGEHLSCSFRQNVFITVSHCVCALWGTARTLHEVSLQESIRYAPGDTVEKWLNDLLCLDCLNITRIVSGCPLPEACELYPAGFHLSCERERGQRKNYIKGLAFSFIGCRPRKRGKLNISDFPSFLSLKCFCSDTGLLS